MRIVQIAPGPYFKVNGRLAAELASVRLRAIEPGLALERLGHPMRIVPYTKLLPGMRDGTLAAGDVFVVQKAMYDVEGVIEWLHARGRTVALDVCDDVFRLPKHAEHYPDMIRAADIVTTSTDAMAAVVRTETGRDARVIPDSLEGEPGRPPSDPSADGALRLLWFGRAANIVPLIGLLPSLTVRRLGLPVRLQVVCNESPALGPLRDAAPRDLELLVTRWSLQAIEAALADCHLVVLPSDDHPIRSVKSANRLERGLWAARPVVAPSSPVLAPYRDAAILADDLAAAIADALSDWAGTVRRACLGQDRVRETRSPEAVAPLWLAALSGAAEARRSAAVARRRLAVLADGRGLAGWINALPAGTALPAGGRREDFDLVIDPTRPLPVADGSLDRLLIVGRAVWPASRWRAAVGDWLRCLRPGGRLIVQWPRNALAAESLAALVADGGLSDVRVREPIGYAGDPAQVRVAGVRPPVRVEVTVT